MLNVRGSKNSKRYRIKTFITDKSEGFRVFQARVFDALLRSEDVKKHFKFSKNDKFVLNFKPTLRGSTVVEFN